MRKNHKKGHVKKHRGNPHGNPPHFQTERQETSDDNLRQSGRPGVSQSPKLKQ